MAYVHSGSGHPSRVPEASVDCSSPALQDASLNDGCGEKERTERENKSLHTEALGRGWGGYIFKNTVSRNKTVQLKRNETLLHMEGRSLEDGTGSRLPVAVGGGKAQRESLV